MNSPARSPGWRDVADLTSSGAGHRSGTLGGGPSAAAAAGGGSPARHAGGQSPDASGGSRRWLRRPPELDDTARPIMPYTLNAAPGADFPAIRDLGVAIGTEVRKTVNELEQTLARREQENLNLKIMVRELEEERRTDELSKGMLNAAAVEVQNDRRSRDGFMRQGQLPAPAWRSPQKAHTATCSMSPTPFPPLDSLRIGGSPRETDRYHEETRQLRAQLNELAAKLAQSEASSNLASAQVETADKQVLSLSEQLIDLKNQMVAASRARASDQVEILQLREAREQLESANKRHLTVIAELDTRHSHDMATLQKMTEELAALKVHAEREMEAKTAIGRDEELATLGAQNSEYRATIIQQEASIAELKTHLARDSALVVQLKGRVEQQEGLLVEQSAQVGPVVNSANARTRAHTHTNIHASLPISDTKICLPPRPPPQLCQQEAHIAELERELRQQQAWDSLGAPEEAGEGAGAAVEEAASGSTSEVGDGQGPGARAAAVDAGGEGPGGGGEAGAVAAARRNAAAAREVCGSEGCGSEVYGSEACGSLRAKCVGATPKP